MEVWVVVELCASEIAAEHITGVARVTCVINNTIFQIHMVLTRATLANMMMTPKTTSKEFWDKLSFGIAESSKSLLESRYSCKEKFENETGRTVLKGHRMSSIF